MMRKMETLRVDPIADGPGPNERIVKLDTRDGAEELVVSARVSGELQVRVIERSREWILVELPAETARGNWRVWVNVAETVGALN